MLKINGDTIFTAQRPNIWSVFIESKCSETSFVLLSCRHQRIIIQRFSTRWPEWASAQWSALSIELFHRSVTESPDGNPYFILITKEPFMSQKSPCFVSKLLSGEWVYRLGSTKEWQYFELGFKKIQSAARRGILKMPPAISQHFKESLWSGCDSVERKENVVLGESPAPSQV